MQECETIERHSFRRGLRRLSEEYRRRVMNAVRELSRNPKLGRKLRGRYEGLWRYKVGKYRIVYDYAPCRIVLLIIEHRETVYQR